jgi:hypothetical protein
VAIEDVALLHELTENVSLVLKRYRRWSFTVALLFQPGSVPLPASDLHAPRFISYTVVLVDIH